MMDLKKILLGSAAVILPGGFVAVAAYLLYKKYRSDKNAICDEGGDKSSSKDENQAGS